MAKFIIVSKQPLAIHNLPPTNGTGFTLIETLVSLLVLSVAITAVFYIFNIVLKDASVIKNNFIASGLVQDGMEVVRNIRDSDWHADNAFGASIPDGSYRVQWNSYALLPLAPDPYLKKDSGTGFMSYDTGNDTIFKRAVTISAVSSAEKRVTVTVTWNERGMSKSVSAEDHLFDWK